jgi:glucose/arabinose dehydrogenase
MSRSLLLGLLLLGCATPPLAADVDPTPRLPPPRVGKLLPIPTPGPGVGLERVASGLRAPIAMIAVPGDTRMLVAEQGGRISLLGPDELSPPVLDLSDRLVDGGERGLLSVAVHPKFAENGRLFVHYSERGSGATVVAEYEAVLSGGRLKSMRSAERRLLRQEQPYANHNGGTLAFSPQDGFLYLGLGDGGAAADPHGYGQALDTLLGKILRLDIDAAPEPGLAYAIPKSNPFVDREGARKEIWAYGLRNPWRMAFDRASGDLWIGDVGQNKFEEVHRQPGDSRGGENYGWDIMEGLHCFPERESCESKAFVAPVLEYGHDAGCSVTGGAVYRGTVLLDLQGAYVFGDYCSGRIWAHRDGVTTELSERIFGTGPHFEISSFGEDGAGELYVAAHDTGDIFRFVPGRGVR